MEAFTTPILTTPRLRLRALTEADAPAILALRSNAEVNKYLERPSDFTLDAALSFIKKIKAIVGSGQGFYWALTLKDDDQLIGTLCYWNLEPAHKKAEIGYELYPGKQGLGLMHEALQLVMAYGFESAGFELITACPLEGNERSVRLLTKNGFTLNGKLPSDSNQSCYLDYQLAKNSWRQHNHK